MAEAKTNAQRMAERAKIALHTYTYDADAAPDGVAVAAMIGRPAGEVFKTIVARGARRGVHVFVVPVGYEIDLKKAARAAGEKSVELVRVDELLGLTGYVRGGCSPVGMKKAYPVVIDERARSLPEMVCSAGRRGLQMALAPHDLVSLCRAEFADLCAVQDV